MKSNRRSTSRGEVKALAESPRALTRVLEAVLKWSGLSSINQAHRALGLEWDSYLLGKQKRNPPTVCAEGVSLFISQLHWLAAPPPTTTPPTQLKADQEFERCKHSFGKHQARLSLALCFFPFLSFFFLLFFLFNLLNHACTQIELAFVPEALKVL